MTEICIGTAQFGFDYGITNKKGQVSNKEIKKILNFAKASSIKFIDTAYGYGESEKNLGKANIVDYSFKVISKYSDIKSKTETLESFDELNKRFYESLERLGVNNLEALLIHNVNEFENDKLKKLIKWLIKLKDKKLINKVGISIYSPKELEDLDLKLFDLVQLPISIYDQRLLDNGTINSLHSQGISIHARSIFLQGLILSPSENWPLHLSEEFRKHHHKVGVELNKKGLTYLDLTLGFIQRIKEIENVIIGFTSLDEIKNVVRKWNDLKENSIHSDIFCCRWHNEYDLDPRQW